MLDWVPPEDLTTVWLFNPFRADVFSSVMRHLVELVDRRGSSIRLTYLNPTEDGRLMETGRASALLHPRGSS